MTFKVRITCDDGITRDVEFEIVDYEMEEPAKEA